MDRLKLSFVVDPPQSLCEFLEARDRVAKRSCLESGTVILIGEPLLLEKMASTTTPQCDCNEFSLFISSR